MLISIVADLISLFIAAALALVALILVGVALMIRAEGLFTVENKVIGACVVAAMLLFGILPAFTLLSDDLIFGIVLAVGFVLPAVLLELTERRTRE